MSGRFYAGSREALERDVRGLLQPVEPMSHAARARGAIAPHAGYIYSGVTAAHVFARLDVPRLVVIVGPNHSGRCRAPGGASLWEHVFRATDAATWFRERLDEELLRLGLVP